MNKNLTMLAIHSSYKNKGHISEFLLNKCFFVTLDLGYNWFLYCWCLFWSHTENTCTLDRKQRRERDWRACAPRASALLSSISYSTSARYFRWICVWSFPQLSNLCLSILLIINISSHLKLNSRSFDVKIWKFIFDQMFENRKPEKERLMCKT